MTKRFVDGQSHHVLANSVLAGEREIARLQSDLKSAENRSVRDEALLCAQHDVLGAMQRASDADTKLLDYLSSLRSEASFHYPNGNGKWTFIPDVMRCDESGAIFEGETLREAIRAAKPPERAE